MLRGLTSYALNKKAPEDRRAVKSLNALAAMQVRLDSEEKEKLRGRLEGAYKKRIAARVDGEGGAPGGGGLTGRTRTGSNLSKYIFDEKSASARVVDVSSVTGNERRTLRGAARKVAAISRRDEMRRLRTVTRGADYDGAWGAGGGGGGSATPTRVPRSHAHTRACRQRFDHAPRTKPPPR